jgi:hemerythrin-like metal-binding protein
VPRFIVWNNAYSVGVRRLDEHHMSILRLVNDLYDMFVDGAHADKLRLVLNELVAYTNTHFAYEQYLMELAGYPDIEAHSALHKKMAARTVQLRSEFTSDVDSLSREVFAFLKDWWVSHIRETDMQYAPSIQAQQRREAA